MTKEAYLDYKLNETLVESQGLDLITMGRGRGPNAIVTPIPSLKIHRRFIRQLCVCRDG